MIPPPHLERPARQIGHAGIDHQAPPRPDQHLGHRLSLADPVRPEVPERLAAASMIPTLHREHLALHAGHHAKTVRPSLRPRGRLVLQAQTVGAGQELLVLRERPGAASMTSHLDQRRPRRPGRAGIDRLMPPLSEHLVHPVQPAWADPVRQTRQARFVAASTTAEAELRPARQARFVAASMIAVSGSRPANRPLGPAGASSRRPRPKAPRGRQSTPLPQVASRAHGRHQRPQPAPAVHRRPPSVWPVAPQHQRP